MTSCIASQPLLGASAVHRSRISTIRSRKNATSSSRTNVTRRVRASSDDGDSSATTTATAMKMGDDNNVDGSSSGSDPLAEQFKAMYPGGSGKRIKWGVFQEEVSAAELQASDAESQRSLREAAAENLTNIDADERGRRYKAGTGAAVFCAVLAAFQISTGAPPSQRALMALPLFFALGFVGSGATGL